MLQRLLLKRLRNVKMNHVNTVLSRLFMLTIFVPLVVFAQDFQHPGALHTKKDLDFIKGKVNANEEPWKSAYQQFKTLKADYFRIPKEPFSSLSYTHKPFPVVACGLFNDPNVGCNEVVYDASVAYSLALRFYISEDKVYADRAKRILMDWANELKEIKDANARLIASWTTPWLVNAAEILRYTPNSGWNQSNTNKFNEHLNLMKNYVFWNDSPVNNWMASGIEARIAIAIFQDDRIAFNNALNTWKFRVRTYIYQKDEGAKPINPTGFEASQTERVWKNGNSNPTTAYIDGLCMETCRDINHLKFGVQSYLYGAEIAWSQGEDLYSLEKERFKDFLELHSGWWLGEEIPKNVCQGSINWKAGRESSKIAFDLAYNHLHDRLGMNLPKTLQLINQKRPTGIGPWVQKWETLCYAGRPFTDNEPDITGPDGYTYAVEEQKIVKITDTPYDLAYGNNGKFVYLTNQTKDVPCTNAKFGSDPISGVKKHCFIKESKLPYLGSAIAIPGVLEAENYDFGGEGVSYSDFDTKNNGGASSNFRVNDGVDVGLGNDNNVVGWTSDGEWVEYTVDVNQGGVYDLNITFSSSSGGGELGIDMDGSGLLPNTPIPSTGDWNTYDQMMKSVTLKEGKQVLTLKIVKSGFNIDKLEFSPSIISGTSGLDEENLLVYPNPSQDGVYQLSQKNEFVVYSVQGEEVLTGFSEQVDLSSYPEGVYLLKVGAFSVKLMK